MQNCDKLKKTVKHLTNNSHDGTEERCFGIYSFIFNYTLLQPQISLSKKCIYIVTIATNQFKQNINFSCAFYIQTAYIIYIHITSTLSAYITTQRPLFFLALQPMSVQTPSLCSEQIPFSNESANIRPPSHFTVLHFDSDLTALLQSIADLFWNSFFPTSITLRAQLISFLLNILQ